MNITQRTPAFTPIVLTLETREEADAFWGILTKLENQLPKRSPERSLLIEISNWFTNHAHV